MLSRILVFAAIWSAAADLPLCKIAVDSDVDEPPRRVNPHTMGCHSDSGYAHQSRALFAELIYGNAFEKVPDPPLNKTGTLLHSWIGSENAQLDASEPLVAGSAPLLLHAQGDYSINRGFAGEGLYLRKAQNYGGFLVMKSSSPVVIDVSLQTLQGTTLANTSLEFAGGVWAKVDFSLTPSESTECEGIDFSTAQSAGVACPLNNTYKPNDPMSDRTAHICVRCGGQFVLTLRSGQSARIGYASLQPGEWGRFKGLPVHVEAVKALQRIGVTAIRQGGSFELDANMAWQRQRGPAWLRPSSIDGNWFHADVSGWGMFEMVDLATAMGITPIITTYFKIEPEAYADLVEYCWGNTSTKWGAMRAADGHPEPYEVRHFELGNENPNPRFVEQVKAMEKRATQLGIGGTLSYILSNGWGRNWPNTTQMEEAAALGLGDHLIWDIHVNGGGATDVASYFFSNSSYDTWGAMNLETNYGDYTVQRMLGEAQDLNMHFNYANPRLLGRTGSFCMERSGYNEGGLSDQGLIFFLPNMTWLQPPGHVHAMVSDTWQPMARSFRLSGDCGYLAEKGAISVQSSEDGTTKVLRVVNRGSEAQRLGLEFAGRVTIRTISGADLSSANTPSLPSHVAPSSEQDITAAMAADLPGHSFNVFVASDEPIEGFFV